MSTDKRRADLALPYVHSPDDIENKAGSVMSQTLPMLGMFMRSKILSWAGLFIAVQNLLSQPRLFDFEDLSGFSTLITSLVCLGMSYMDFVYVPVKPAAAT